MSSRCTFCGCTADVALTKRDTGEKVSVCRTCVPRGMPLTRADVSKAEPLRGGMSMPATATAKYRHITRRGFSLL